MMANLLGENHTPFPNQTEMIWGLLALLFSSNTIDAQELRINSKVMTFLLLTSKSDAHPYLAEKDP